MVLEPEITVRWLEVATALATVAFVIQEAMEATEDLVVIRVCLTLNLSVLDFKIVSFALLDKDFFFFLCFNFSLVSGGFGSFVSDGYGGSYGNYGGSYTQVDWWGN